MLGWIIYFTTLLSWVCLAEGPVHEPTMQELAVQESAITVSTDQGTDQATVQSTDQLRQEMKLGSRVNRARENLKDESEFESQELSISDREPAEQAASTGNIEVLKDSEKATAESETTVPAFKKSEGSKETSTSGLGIKALSLFAIFLVMALGLAWKTKGWLQKTNLNNKHTNIRVVTQHHLGPRKSVTIISVAGEFILLGVTDQNINLIKTLSLLDEDLPGVNTSNFNGTLQEAQNRPDFVELSALSKEQVELGSLAKADEGGDSFSIRGIKEAVKQKLKGMKELT